MRLSQAFAYINEPTKPDKDRKLLYTHINIQRNWTTKEFIVAR